MTYDKEKLTGNDLTFRELVEKYFKQNSPSTNLDYVVTSFSKRMSDTNNIALELAKYNFRYGYFMQGKLFTNNDVVYVIGDFNRFYITRDSVLKDIYKNRKRINEKVGKTVVRYFEKSNDYKLALVDCDYLEQLPQVKKVEITK